MISRMQGFALCQGAFPKSKHENFSFRISQLWKPQMQQKKRDHPQTLYKLNQFSFEAFAEHLLMYKQSKQQ